MFKVVSHLQTKDPEVYFNSEVVCKENDLDRIKDCLMRDVCMIYPFPLPFPDVNKRTQDLFTNRLITYDDIHTMKFNTQIMYDLLRESVKTLNDFDGCNRSYTLTITKVRDLTEKEEMDIAEKKEKDERLRIEAEKIEKEKKEKKESNNFVIANSIISLNKAVQQLQDEIKSLKERL